MLRVELVPGADGVHSILKQLSEIDLGSAVEVVREKVDDPSKIDLELVIHEGILTKV
jgi:hypothetical protein